MRYPAKKTEHIAWRYVLGFIRSKLQRYALLTPYTTIPYNTASFKTLPARNFGLVEALI